MKKIVDIQLQLLEKRLTNQNLKIEFTKNIKDYLVKTGYDPVYGARPLKRLINDLIVDELALLLVEGKIKSGDKIVVDYQNKKVVIS